MMQYQNPGYYNAFSQGMLNPYDNRFQYFNQIPQNMQSNINQNQSVANNIGKIVDSIDAVKAADVPMDGNAYYFPKADGTEIYSKQWLSNGTTRILSFKPVFDDKVENSTDKSEKSKFDLSEESTSAFMKRFDDIEMKIMEIEEKFSKSLSKLSNADSKGADK